MACTVEAAVCLDVLVERLAAGLAVNAERVVTTVVAVTSVSCPLVQLRVEVALVRLPAAIARYRRTRTSFVRTSGNDYMRGFF